MLLHHNGISSGKGKEPYVKKWVCRFIKFCLIEARPHCYMVLSTDRERERPQDRLMSQERRGEEWIATKQIVVQCPVCQEYYHLKELKNVDQARNRKLSGVCRWPVLTNVDHVPSRPCHVIWIIRIARAFPSFPFHRFSGLIPGEISCAEDRVRQAARRRLRCPGVLFVVCLVAPWWSMCTKWARGLCLCRLVEPPWSRRTVEDCDAGDADATMLFWNSWCGSSYKACRTTTFRAWI